VRNHPHGAVYRTLAALGAAPPRAHYLEPNPCPACDLSRDDANADASSSQIPNLSSSGGSSSGARFVAVPLAALRAGQRCANDCLLVAFAARHEVQQVTLDVADPRGRFVREVRVWHSPDADAAAGPLGGPDASAAVLRSLVAHASRGRAGGRFGGRAGWVRAGTLTLGRPGQVTSSVTLPLPLTCGHLAFEFAAFHPTADASASRRQAALARGEPGVHPLCPRCGREVPGLHGVCAACSETAFQCRQCRHINYAHLDAFLCVECAYCAYGTFSFSALAAPAECAAPVASAADRTAALQVLAQCARGGQAAAAELALLRPRLLGLAGALGAGPGGGSRDLGDRSGGGGSGPAGLGGGGSLALPAWLVATLAGGPLPTDRPLPAAAAEATAGSGSSSSGRGRSGSGGSTGSGGGVGALRADDSDDDMPGLEDLRREHEALQAEAMADGDDFEDVDMPEGDEEDDDGGDEAGASVQSIFSRLDRAIQVPN
jgi:hypothetical protein